MSQVEERQNQYMALVRHMSTTHSDRVNTAKLVVRPHCVSKYRLKVTQLHKWPLNYNYISE